MPGSIRLSIIGNSVPVSWPKKLGPLVIIFSRAIFESVVPDVGAKVEFVQGIGPDYRAGLNLRIGVGFTVTGFY